MPSNDKAAVSAMVLSNDASQLAVVVDKSKPRFLFRSPKNCELRIYDINSSYDSIALSDSLVFNQNYISSLAYSQNNTYLYFQKQDMQGNAVLHRYNLNSQSSEAITAVTAQGKLRYADSLLYIMHDSKIEVLAHTDTTLAYIEKSTLNAAASFRYSGISSSSAIGMHGSLTYGYNGDTYYRCLAKQYELKDHLGNVRVVISDVKEPNATYDQFTADLKSYYNYYAFGMLQPNRHYTLAEEYKFGFNGMEMDDEITGGTGEHYDFGARIYSSRLGRWLSLDPMQARYPNLSSYNYCADNPVYWLDKGGNVLWVGGNREKAMEDLKSILPEPYRPYLMVTEEGQVVWDLEKMNHDGIVFDGNESGQTLMSFLINAEEQYLYQVADVAYELRGGPDGKVRNSEGKYDAKDCKGHRLLEGHGLGVNNSSTTKRNRAHITEINLKGKNFLYPLANDGSIKYDGIVTISENASFTVNGKDVRKNIVFHELWENYERTTNGKPYQEAQYDEYGNAKLRKNGMEVVPAMNDTGAHQSANEAEGNFYDPSSTPGSANVKHNQ